MAELIAIGVGGMCIKGGRKRVGDQTWKTTKNLVYRLAGLQV